MSKSVIVVLLGTLLAMAAGILWVPMRNVAHSKWVHRGQPVRDDRRASGVRWGWVWETWRHPYVIESAREDLEFTAKTTVVPRVDWLIVGLTHSAILLLGGGLLTFVVRRERRRKAAA